MIISKESIFGIHHFRTNRFLFRFLYLKALIRIFGLIRRLNNKFQILGGEVRHVNGYRAYGVD